MRWLHSTVRCKSADSDLLQWMFLIFECIFVRKFPFVLSKEHIPIFSILPHNTILNSLEVAKILATNYDIVINHGYQCSQPLYRKFHIDGGAIRFSFHVYNTKEDVDYIFESLSNILISTKM